jgi:hypothetical protein
MDLSGTTQPKTIDEARPGKGQSGASNLIIRLTQANREKDSKNQYLEWCRGDDRATVQEVRP